jgi:peptide/nickel transport system substrate-binding protein|uniref:ABC transporter substrate-binding protein n=1 Tax=Desulfobacca acetoxidans TaxID=60893 RepID=A0A7V6A591_9BACT
MAKRSLWLTVLILVLAGAGLLSAGGGATPRPYLIGDPQGDWGFPSPFAHNPRGPGYLRVSFLFDTLIWKDARGFIPALADSWEYQASPPAYVFRLHPGVIWHDGQPLTARDVAFTIDYLKKHPHPWVDLRPISTVEVLDPLTVRLVLSQPYAPFLEEIAGTMFILPRHIWEQVEDPIRFQDARACVGSGPYRLAEYRREHGLYRFVAFETYYRGKPTASEIGFVQVGNELVALKGKAVQAAAVPPEAVQELKDQGFTVLSQPHFFCLKLLFNHHKFPQQELAFRRALAQAVNLPDLVAQTLRGYGLPASPGLLPPDSPWYCAPQARYPFDPAAAARLLESLGYRRTPEGWMRDGHLLALELLSSPAYARVAEYLKKSFQNIGLTVHLRQVDHTILDQRVKNQQFDLALSGHGGLGGDPKFINDVCTGPLAREFLGGYQPPPKMVQLLTDQLQTLDEAKRRLLVARIQEQLAYELPALPLFYPTWYLGHDGRIPWFFTRGGIAKGIPVYFNKVALLPGAASASPP